ncbi:MAG: hypothetical protein LBI87_10170 [Candidatus Accumulibacter sp.]|jgi:hypothetical protein|nr:hypothetical protein [Accumulibacter sp.]
MDMIIELSLQKQSLSVRQAVDRVGGGVFLPGRLVEAPDSREAPWTNFPLEEGLACGAARRSVALDSRVRGNDDILEGNGLRGSPGSREAPWMSLALGEGKSCMGGWERMSGGVGVEYRFWGGEKQKFSVQFTVKTNT